jgi:hypothetical protein
MALTSPRPLPVHSSCRSMLPSVACRSPRKRSRRLLPSTSTTSHRSPMESPSPPVSDIFSRYGEYCRLSLFLLEQGEAECSAFVIQWFVSSG